jgi:hypothetical protein
VPLHGRGEKRRDSAEAPLASLGISPADSNVLRTTQLPLALAPLRLRSGSVGVGQDDRVWGGIGEDESVEGISLNLKQKNS